MKAATIIHLVLGLFVISFLVSCLAFSPQQAQAQDSGYLESSEKYSREELTQMLAPIALYPDALLSQVLMASTYPIEVIEADRWVRRNPELKDEALGAALLDKDWEPSVKAICHFPSILALMSERVSETTNLGNAFLAQEDEVMDMVQELRAKAYAQDNLSTTSQQKVIVEKETIIIEPADPGVIYVPYYDPFYIYGPWWYPAYRPYYWGPPGMSIGVGISYWPVFYFGFDFGTWSYFDWNQRYIYIDVHKRPRYVRHDRWKTNSGRWHHAPIHRRGVAFRDKHTARKYGQYPDHRFREFRSDTRGFPERRVRDLDGDRRVDDRNRIDRDKRGDDRIKIDRDRQERQRIDRDKQERKRAADRDKQIRERADRDKQERQRIDRDKQERKRAADRDKQIRERTDRDQQKRQRIERDKQERKRAADRDKQIRERTDQAQQERERVDRNRQMRERQERVGIDRDKQKRVEREPQMRQRPQQEKQVSKPVDSSKAVQRERAPDQSRDNVFNRFDNGGREHQSSERGRVSRQGRGDDSRSRGGRSDSDDRGRNRQ